MKNLKLSLLSGFIITVGIISCGKKDSNPTLIIKTDSIKVAFSANSPNTFFSFKNNSIVANNDSASTKWDFGLRFVNFIFNSNGSGPGNAGVIVKQGFYDTVRVAPLNGYSYDTTSTKLAIPYDLNNSWFLYNSVTHVFSAKAGWYFIIRTAESHYVKMEILSVTYLDYTGGSTPPTTLVYKFRYSYKADGSVNF